MKPLAISSGNFGSELCKALGLEERCVREITLQITAQSLVQVTIVENLYEENGKRVNELVSKYVLVEPPQ